jgi:hypothetical protein
MNPVASRRPKTHGITLENKYATATATATTPYAFFIC